jgi:AcrR family transcriptional regulator
MGNLKDAAPASPAAPRRRKRRSTSEIVDRIIDAAFLEFSANGYANATTAAIARRADVAEGLIFTHFGTKANLFRNAVFKPLDNHFSYFFAKHHTPNGTEEDVFRESRQFVSQLVAFIRQHLGMFKSLVVNEAYGNDAKGASGLQGLQDYIERMSTLEDESTAQGLKIPLPLVSRVSFASILGCVLFNEWLFPDGVASDDDIHEAICDFIMEGLSANPMASRPPKTAPVSTGTLPTRKRASSRSL